MSARRKTVLVIDAHDDARERLAQTLRRDYRVIRAASAEAGLALMDREDVDVLVADVQQTGLGGLDLLQIVRENFPLVEIIMTSAAPDVDGAVKAIKLGAYHFLTKDADPDVMRGLVRHAGERQDLNRHVLTLQDAAGEAGGRDFITGPSTALKDVLETVHKVAKLSATILILGESGTGQGTAGPPAASRVGQPRGGVHRRQRRGDSTRAGREHAVRTRERRVHRRAAAAHRQVRAGQRRHVVPRRDRRPQTGPAGQAAARDPGRRGRTRRRHAADPHRVPADCRDQRRSRARREGRRRSARTCSIAST